MTFEQEVEIIKESYERIIEEEKAKTKELQKQINAIKRNNNDLDMQIEGTNVDICEFKLEMDEKLQKVEQYILKER